MAGPLKRTTGLVGLAVEAKPLERLKLVYEKVLGALQEIPKESGYREYTEQMVKDRMIMIEKDADVSKIENKLNVGQIEEVIRQADDELSLARKIVGWKVWEPLKEEAPPNQWKWPV
ncbi:NADH dehydrogenase [ubiquinone] 1 alpha subcomplex subunit 5-like [Apostichopus japonicus]|uniref:NADH dehydrogenase [ubiquinone] 1 alpha subcomplex subunit 5-like n=1 Tax=Stichopus japonicus TaxID=307972 RepID=UPI003AB2D16A